jgi:hypothetical protein
VDVRLGISSRHELVVSKKLCKRLWSIVESKEGVETIVIRQELIDKLLSEYQKPEDLLREEGLLKRLKKALIERVLEGELDHHPSAALRADSELSQVRTLWP